MRLYLVRHLQPMVAPGVCYGRTDLVVSQQVHDAALPQLRAQMPAGVPVHSSPMLRCASLANALAPDRVRFDARLMELDFGAWEMRAWNTIARPEIDAWAADVALYRPGGGESVFDMAQRICAFYDALLRENVGAAVLVCHAGAIRLLAARARGLGPLAMAQQAAQSPHAISYGQVTIIESV
ncbi:MAG: histidine phosphatase family protein [Telluria sp.]